ncbi:MAG: response regulator [Burkholderiales bacterium]|nr:response regulator [Burkholderiales bacterium]
MREKKGSVLCVDDEPNILRSLHWMLHKEYDVRTAPDGATALQMLRANDFDVIVSDQRMPGMIGSDLLRQACEVAPRAMRILLTGYSDMQAILKSINEGEVFRFVNKPWSNEELCRTVAEACEIARTQPAPQPATAAAVPPPDAGGDSVLLLDDDLETARLVGEVLGGTPRLLHASSMAEAVAMLGSEKVGVIVAELKVARADATPLLKLLKQSHPEIVSVVLTSDTDVDSVIKLINQGQVYRFVPKPVKPVFLKILLASAMQKHRALKNAPDSARRHAVQQAPQGLKEALLRDVQQEAARLAPRQQAGTSWVDRIGGGLRRLFKTA